MPRHIRTGDTVMVTTGRKQDRGRSGKVLRIITHADPNAQRVVVEGINVHTKHVQRSQANPQGGTIDRPMPVHISNVQPLDGEGKPTRVRFESRADGSKVRLAATTGGQLGPQLKKAR